MYYRIVDHKHIPAKVYATKPEATAQRDKEEAQGQRCTSVVWSKPDGSVTALYSDLNEK